MKKLEVQSVAAQAKSLAAAGDGTFQKNFKLTQFMHTLFDEYVGKTEKLFEKGGKALEKATKFIGKVGKGLAGIGLVFSIADAFLDYQENGVNWKVVTKAAIGIGLAFAAFTTAPVGLVGFLYGVADYFGLIDSVLNKIDQGLDYFKNLYNNMISNITNTEQNLRRGVY